jgi:hypothetical protein
MIWVLENPILKCLYYRKPSCNGKSCGPLQFRSRKFQCIMSLFTIRYIFSGFVVQNFRVYSRKWRTCNELTNLKQECTSIFHDVLWYLKTGILVSVSFHNSSVKNGFNSREIQKLNITLPLSHLRKLFTYIVVLWAGLFSRYSVWIGGGRVQGSNSGGGEILFTRPDPPWGPPSLL